MLAIGNTAPDFELPDQTGRATTLAELTRAGTLILYFYPADFTPVCTREVCLFRDAHDDLADAGLAVAGISPNDVESHARFHAAMRLNHPLLSDTDRAAIRAYGVAGPFGFGVRRATFVIDAARRIRAAVKADFRLARHRALVEQALAAR